jgi:hypothetical protein
MIKPLATLSFILIPAYVGFSAQTTLTLVFSEAFAAVGNEREIAKIRSITAAADCVGPKGKYTTSIVSFKSSKTIFEQTYSYKDKPSSVFVNGDVVWEKESTAGDPMVSTPFQRMVVRAHEYQKMAFDFQKFFEDFSLVGDEVFEGRASIKVRSKNELGMTTFLFFDKQNKRFSGYVMEMPTSNQTVKNAFLEWKKVGNLMLPSVIKATDMEGDWTLRFHTIKLNSGDEKLLAIPPRIADMADLLRLHEQQKTAHLLYNAELFIEMFGENLTQLQRGNAVTRTKAENLARFKSYFSSFKFQEWEDIKPPVIKLAQDGSMATVIVQKRVRGTYKNEKGEDESDHTIFAWLEVWEKIDGKWKVTTVASTEKAGQN